MTVATTIIDVSRLARVIEGSLIAGIGITVFFSLVIWGSTRASDYARADQRSLALVHAAIATVAAAVVAAGIVYGFTILTTK